ncbi:hypothetical protein [Streptomyces sp. NPDC059176]|uniref:hypothetical protein n=1 Tax=Streptomyces sp. NPDC059176 TaxID=3346758 RepID=UPI0036A972CA
MKHPGPLVTLLAGLVLGLFMLSLNATTGEPAPSSAASTAPSTPGLPSPSPSSNPASPTPARTPPSTAVSSARPQAEYAGRTGDDTASVAVSVRGDKAIAYFCDGRTREAWLRGPVEADGDMHLTGETGARLDGNLTGGEVTGAVRIGDRTWPFTAAEARKPAGLYRATAEVRGARLKGGWIITRDGRQVGIVSRDGKPAAAPPIDPATGAVTVDGTPLTARPVVP